MKSFAKFAAAALVLLALPALAQPLNPFITFTPFHANGLYKAGERYGWTVRAPMGMSTQDPLAYDFTIRENNQTVIASGTIDLSSGSATIAGVLDHPAMVYVRLAPDRAGMVTPPPAAPLPRLHRVADPSAQVLPISTSLRWAPPSSPWASSLRSSAPPISMPSGAASWRPWLPCRSTRN